LIELQLDIEILQTGGQLDRLHLQYVDLNLRT